MNLAEFSFTLKPSLDTINLFAVSDHIEEMHLAQRVRAAPSLNASSVARLTQYHAVQRMGERAASWRTLWRAPSARPAWCTRKRPAALVRHRA